MARTRIGNDLQFKQEGGGLNLRQQLWHVDYCIAIIEEYSEEIMHTIYKQVQVMQKIRR